MSASMSHIRVNHHSPPRDNSSWYPRARTTTAAWLALIFSVTIVSAPGRWTGPRRGSARAVHPAIPPPMVATQARIQYSHIDKGLAVPAGKPLQGFSLAGADKVWHWADAKLDGDTVPVSSPKVPQPVDRPQARGSASGSSGCSASNGCHSSS